MTRALFLGLLALAPSVAAAPSFPVVLSGEFCLGFICDDLTVTLFEDGSATSDLGDAEWRYKRRTNELMARLDSGEVWIGVRDGDCFSGPVELDGFPLGDATLCVE